MFHVMSKYRWRRNPH